MGLTPEFKKFIGTEFNTWRLNNRLSLRDVTQMTGVSASTLFRYEHGFSVKPENLNAVLEAMGKTLPELLSKMATYRQPQLKGLNYR